MSAARLSASQIEQAVAEVPQWVLSGDAIQRSVVAESYAQALRWVNAIAAAAEELVHHPDLHWVYTRLEFRLSTHDAGGLTALDFQLASRIDRVLMTP